MKNSILILGILVSFATQAEVIDRIIAIVNDEPILSSEIRNLQKNLTKPGYVDENLLQGQNPQSLKSDQAALDYLILEKVVASEIKKAGLSVTDDRAEQEYKSMAKRAGLSEAELGKALQGQGVDIKEYKQFLKKKTEKQSLLDNEIISKLRVSDEEALSQYEKQNPGKKISINEYTLSHIFFNPRKDSAENALERARSVREKLLSGGNFETLARQNSEDPNFAEGGRLGTFKSGDFLPEIEEAIQNLKEGQITGVVRSKLGFHVVKVNRIQKVPDPKFNKERDRIKESLMAQAFNRQLASWLKSKKEDAFIHINKQ